MKGVINQIRNNFDTKCLVESRIGRGKCNLYLKDITTNRIIVDFDKEGSPLDNNQLRCDFLLIAQSNHKHFWVVLIEIKTGKLRANKVISQLQKSATTTEQYVRNNKYLRFRPIALSRGISTQEFVELNKTRNKI